MLQGRTRALSRIIPAVEKGSVNLPLASGSGR
jgi:hypothetical protein